MKIAQSTHRRDSLVRRRSVERAGAGTDRRAHRRPGAGFLPLRLPVARPRPCGLPHLLRRRLLPWIGSRAARGGCRRPPNASTPKGTRGLDHCGTTARLVGGAKRDGHGGHRDLVARDRAALDAPRRARLASRHPARCDPRAARLVHGSKRCCRPHGRRLEDHVAPTCRAACPAETKGERARAVAEKRRG